MGRIGIEREASGVVRLEVEGEIGAAEMEYGLDALFAAVEPHERSDMLYIVRGMRVPTLGAMRVELGQIGRLWRLLSKLGRVALVADQAWVRTAAKAEAAVIPGLHLRTFEPHKESAARAWISA